MHLADESGVTYLPDSLQRKQKILITRQQLPADQHYGNFLTSPSYFSANRRVYLMKAVRDRDFPRNVLRCVVCTIGGITASRPFAFMRRYKIVSGTNIGLPTSKHFRNKLCKFFTEALDTEQKGNCRDAYLQPVPDEMAPF